MLINHHRQTTTLTGRAIKLDGLHCRDDSGTPVAKWLEGRTSLVFAVGNEVVEWVDTRGANVFVPPKIKTGAELR
jgi:hypothetical protein